MRTQDNVTEDESPFFTQTRDMNTKQKVLCIQKTPPHNNTVNSEAAGKASEAFFSSSVQCLDFHCVHVLCTLAVSVYVLLQLLFVHVYVICL